MAAAQRAITYLQTAGLPPGSHGGLQRRERVAQIHHFAGRLSDAESQTISDAADKASEEVCSQLY